MRSKDALTLLHLPLAVWVNVLLVTKIMRYTQRLQSLVESLSPPSYMASRHAAHAFVISGYWSLFTWDVSNYFLDFVGGTKLQILKLDLGLGFHQSNPCSSIDSSTCWTTSSECLTAECPIACLTATKTTPNEWWWTKKRIKVHIKSIFENWNIPFNRIETLASNWATSISAFAMSYLSN